MNTTIVSAHDLTRDSRDILLATLAEAFMEVPASRYLVPNNETARYEALKQYFGLWMEHAIKHGAVYCTTDLAGCAVWLYVQPGVSSEPEGYEDRLRVAVSPETFKRMQRFDVLMDSRIPDTPSGLWYLTFMGVATYHQRQGIGSALLEAHHARCDKHGLPAFLEAGDPESLRLYAKHGYEPLGAPLVLPDASELYPALRQPA